MTRIGRHPIWTPTSTGDRILVSILTGGYVVMFLPMQVLTRAFGWSRLDWILLDLLSIPGKLLAALGSLFGKRGQRWGMKANALEHTYFVCRMCPLARQKQRDPNGGSVCAWNANWNAGNFGIRPDFGAKNWLRQFVTNTRLDDYKDLATRAKRDARKQTIKGKSSHMWMASGALWVFIGFMAYI